MTDERDCMERNIEIILANANVLCERIDRLTDENRRLRAKVEELTANASDARAELAKRSSEIAKLQFTIDNLRLELAKRQGPEALAEACKSIGTVAVAVTPDYVTRAELVDALREVITLVDGPAFHALARLKDIVQGEP
jgi:hypothetical protein